ncbi:hypothetical protein BS50DRAFT_586122 [Corynespora cassiicola Philippines]|uniref:Uncharacterized protein n=1 Tax=Corynespora cassiicola Philippines TaxID=1448308 RepID=A0A2T2NTB0_CORCC|nr:hypothetical protein BS50DRAFT_586122 [Corynespora cassiicola Philippines]
MSPDRAATVNEGAGTQFIESLVESRDVFTYMNHEEVMNRVNNNLNDIRGALQIIESQIPFVIGLVAHWDEFYPTYMAQVSDHARSTQTLLVQMIRKRLGVNTNSFISSILSSLTKMENDIPKMGYPFEDKPN